MTGYDLKMKVLSSLSKVFADEEPIEKAFIKVPEEFSCGS